MLKANIKNNCENKFWRIFNLVNVRIETKILTILIFVNL